MYEIPSPPPPMVTISSAHLIFLDSVNLIIDIDEDYGLRSTLKCRIFQLLVTSLTCVQNFFPSLECPVVDFSIIVLMDIFIVLFVFKTIRFR
jgi:hypothetical protein